MKITKTNSLSSIVNINKKLQYSKLNSFAVLVFSLGYGYFLSQFPDMSFKDYRNYLTYAQSSLEIALRYIDEGMLAVFSNEPIWLLINWIFELALSPEHVIQAIIFFSAASISWVILHHHPRYFLILVVILFSPLVIKNYLIHLRQGLAISIFFCGWFSKNKSTRIVLMCGAGLIHSSFFFVTSLLIFVHMLERLRFNLSIKVAIYIAFAVFVILITEWFADLVGARQSSEQSLYLMNASSLGFLQWISVAGIMLTAGTAWLQKHFFECGMVIFYLLSYWFIGIGARIFESVLIIVFLSGLFLPRWRRNVFIGVAILPGLIDLILRFGQPAFGFSTV